MTDADDLPTIAAVQGANSAEIQRLFATFAASVSHGRRVVGVLEVPTGTPDGDAYLQSLTDGAVFPLFEDLGPGSRSCGLDGHSVAIACETVCRDIAAGCDLIVLSKFGRLESERTGLMGAFIAGVDAQTPILTSVGPRYDAAWASFAGPLSVVLSPELAAIEDWWRKVARMPPGPSISRHGYLERNQS